MHLCSRTITRVGNHLRQFHGLTDKDLINRLKSQKLPVQTFNEDTDDADEEFMDEENQTIEESCSEEDVSEDEYVLTEKLIHDEAKAVSQRDMKFNTFDSGSEDSDVDWLLTQTGDDMKPKRKPTRAKNVTSQKTTQNIDAANNFIETDGMEGKKSGAEISEEEDSGEEDGDNNDDEEYDDEEPRYFMSSLKEDKLYDIFMKWLQSLEGSHKSLRQAKKHKNVLMGILRFKSTDVDFNNLFNRGYLNEWVTYAEDVKKMQAGSIKTYLNSVQHFHRFSILANDVVLKDKYVTKESLEKVTILDALFKQWFKTLSKRIQARKHEKALEDMAKFPTGQEMRDFDKSEAVAEAKQMLKTYRDSLTFQLTRANFCHIRDYLLTYLIFDNASRPGAVANMKLGEFFSAKESKNGYTVSVIKHKTSYKGPAMIYLSNNLYNQTKDFIHFLRNKITDIGFENDDAVFVTWSSGGPMASNLVSTQFCNFWNKGIKSFGRKMNPTIVRKFSTTCVLEKMPSFGGKTANHMCHSEAIQKSHYHLYDKQKTAPQTSQVIREVQRMNANENEDDYEAMLLHFKDFIENETMEVNMSAIKKRLLEEGFTLEDRKVVDGIRYRINKRRKLFHQASPKDLDKREAGNFEESDGDNINEQNQENPSTDRSRKNYSSEENMRIRKYLKPYIKEKTKSIVGTEFETFVRNIPEISDIVKSRGIHSLIVKVRTERKK